jgi:heptosyltransferase-2/heptosyltransferase-3
MGARQPELRGLLTDPVTLNGCHAVERNAEMLDFAATRLGAAASCQPVTWEIAPLSWTVTPDDQERASSMLRSIDVASDYFVIHPGSGAPAKLWPADRWARIADEVSRRGFEVVLTGGESERALVDRIAGETACRIRSLVGKTSLKTLAAVFQRARVVAGVDSGPLHLAVAVDTPTLHLFGPSEPARFGPWGDPTTHPVVSAGMRCKSCGDLRLSRPEGTGCMLAIRERQVAGVLGELLRR